MITIKEFTFNAFQENTYLLSDETKECIIIDAGCYDKEEKEELKQYISENDLKVVSVINTHCHIDHVLGNQFVKDTYQVDLAIPEKEADTLAAVPVYAPNYGFITYEHATPDTYIKEGDKITFGNSSLDVLFVPGHSLGHMAFYHKEQQFCINGDVLFQGSIGRTDLPGGDFETLIHSIKTVMFALPDNTTVYCGHGPATTIAFEKQHNPFCGEAAQ